MGLPVQRLILPRIAPGQQHGPAGCSGIIDVLAARHTADAYKTRRPPDSRSGSPHRVAGRWSRASRPALNSPGFGLALTISLSVSY